MNDLLVIILFSGGPILGLFATSLGYKTYRKFEYSVNFGLGLILLVLPEIVYSETLKSEFDYFHRFLAGIYGIYCLFSAFFVFMLRNTTDEGVYYGHIWSRIIEASLLVVDSLYVYFDGTYWNYKIIFLVTIFSIIGVISNAIFFSESKQPKPQYQPNDIVNYFAKFEFWAFLIFGIIAFSFPDIMCFGLETPNEGHRSLARTVAANVLANAFQVFFLSDFKSNDDKRSYYLSRLIVNQIELLFMITCFLSSPLSKWYLMVNIPYSIWLYLGYRIIPEEQVQSKKN